MNPYTLRKTLRALEIARVNRLPVINLVESGGADLPTPVGPVRAGRPDLPRPDRALRAGHPDHRAGLRQLHRGRRLRAGHVRLRRPGRPAGQGVPRRPAAGQDGHRRGRPTTRSWAARRCTRRVSGLSDYFATDELDCIRIGRQIVTELNWRKLGPGPAEPARRPPAYDPDELLGVVSADFRVPFDPREVLARVVDGSEFGEYKPLYGTSLVTGWAIGARLSGRHPGQRARRAVQRGGQEGHRVHPAGQPDRHARWSSCRTPPATWSARTTSRAASSRTAPR